MALPPSPLAIWDSLHGPFFSTICLPHPSHHNHNHSSTNNSTSTHPSYSPNSSYLTNTATSTQSSHPLSNHHPHSHFHHLSNYIPHPHLLYHHQHQQPIQTTIITTSSSYPPHHLYAPYQPHPSTSGPLCPSTPPLTIHETPTTYLLTLDVPGATSRSAITLRLKTPHLLSISGSTPPSTFSAPPLPHGHHLSPAPSTATATTSPTSTSFTHDHEASHLPIPSPPHSPASFSPEEAVAFPTFTPSTHEESDAEEDISLVRVDSHDDPGMTACAHIAAADTRGPNPYPKYCSSLSESLYQCSVVSPVESPTWKSKRNGKNEGKEGTEAASRLVLEERRTGQWERDFSFAVKVKREDVEARLEAGVLRVWVRKRQTGGEEGGGGGGEGAVGGGVTWVD